MFDAASIWKNLKSVSFYFLSLFFLNILNFFKLRRRLLVKRKKKRKLQNRVETFYEPRVFLPRLFLIRKLGYVCCSVDLNKFKKRVLLFLFPFF